MDVVKALPQILFLAMMLISFGRDLARHNQEVTKTENGWVSLLATIIMIAWLWWGGWWDVFLK